MRIVLLLLNNLPSLPSLLPLYSAILLVRVDFCVTIVNFDRLQLYSSFCAPTLPRTSLDGDEMMRATNK